MFELSKAANEVLIADLSAKVGLRVQFVKDYLASKSYSYRDFSRAVVGAGVAGKLRDLSNAIFMDAELPQF